jgi:hypothetical protein
VAKDPELALITYTALLDAVEKSNAHAVICELPQQKKTGYVAWLTMEEAMEGNDHKESFLKLAEESLKSDSLKGLYYFSSSVAWQTPSYLCSIQGW